MSRVKTHAQAFKRNWRKWTLGYASHWLVGAVIGFGSTTAFWPASLIGALFVMRYQRAEWEQIADSWALDSLDYGIGFAVGAGLGVGLKLLGVA